MIIDTITIIVCSVLLILAVVATMCNPLLHRLVATLTTEEHDNDNDDEVKQSPKLSVIITVHDQAQDLENHLPIILSQDYEPGYEVIVVDESSTDDTEDVLNRMKQHCKNLYTTFIPESSHYLSRRKLALTLGVKAAKNEWLVFTDADCQPESDQWLKAIAKQCTDQTDIVLGYTRYENKTPLYWRFERLISQWRLMKMATKGMAYRYNGNNLAVRKSIFMKHNGFLKNLKYLRGEYDFMVNEYAQPNRTAIALEPDARICQNMPSKRAWVNTHLYYLETQQHLRGAHAYKIKGALCSTLLHLAYLTQIGVLSFSIVTNMWIVMAVSIFCLLLTFTLRGIIGHNALKNTGEQISTFCIPFMEIRAVWQYLIFKIRYIHADKYDFIRR